MYLVGDRENYMLSLAAIIGAGLLAAAQPQPGAPDACPSHVPPAATVPATAPAAITPGAITKLDPLRFFQQLVDRYHNLAAYTDSATVVQVTQRRGEDASRVETSINCKIADGKLTVQTPKSQVRNGLGLNLPVKTTQEMKDIQLRYDLWLAPHMAMKFTEQPLKSLRAGIEEGFTATQAEPVTIDNKSMVHIELRSGDGTSEDYAAKFDLFVNPQSMLIERIDGEQHLADGATYSTTLQITPEVIEPAAALPASEVPIEAPAAIQPAT